MARQKESILLTRWLAKFHRDKPQWKRVRLGVPANPEEAKFLQVALRWADAIFLEDGIVNIVETKLKNLSSGIDQLNDYAELFKVTPEFSSYVNWPIKKILVSPFLDLFVAEKASKNDVEYIVWKPLDWHDEIK